MIPANIAPTQLERPATVPVGAVFWHAGRPLKVTRVYGTDAAAPVICEELTAVGRWGLPGQYTLWGLLGVMRAMVRP